MADITTEKTAERLDVPLDRDIFLRTLIRELSGTLEDVVGLSEAAGYISVVGQNVGEEMNRNYKAAFEVSQLTRQQVGQVLVDLKRRINGKFFIIEETPEKIVLGNTACPFGDKVLNRPSMCMMTSNVFGSIAAQNLTAMPRSSCRRLSRKATRDAGLSSISTRQVKHSRLWDASISDRNDGSRISGSTRRSAGADAAGRRWMAESSPPTTPRLRSSTAGTVGLAEHPLRP